MTEPLRIAVFVHEFPALSETFVLNQVTGLLDLGCDVSIFANRRRPDAVEHGDVALYDLRRRTCYLDMPANKLRRLAAARSLIACYHNRIPQPIRRSLDVPRYRRDAWSLKLLYWTIRLVEWGNRFDVVYCHFGTIGRTAAFLREIGALHGALVTAFHGVDVSASLRRSPHIYRHLFAQGDMFLPVSHHWAARLQVHGCDPNRMFVHHMGVDPERFRFQSRQPPSDGAIRLLTVGRMVEKKGMTHALRAVARAREQNVRLRYTVIGDGPLRPSLEALAVELGLHDIVVFRGWCHHTEIAAQMYDSDILIAPSVTDRRGDQEGIPVTLMEAMATGLPVISSRHSGIPELVRHGESGLLVEEADVAGLASSIARLGQDRALRAAMGKAGHAIVRSEFNTRTLNHRLLQLFEMTCRRTAGRTVDLPLERLCSA